MAGVEGRGITVGTHAPSAPPPTQVPPALGMLQVRIKGDIYQKISNKATMTRSSYVL